MTGQLHLEGYEINAKKVYRLMRANDLLLSRLKKPRGPYVQQRCAQPDAPLTLFEMDIKMIWVEEYRRYAYVLTILDTFTRCTGRPPTASAGGMSVGLGKRLSLPTCSPPTLWLKRSTLKSVATTAHNFWPRTYGISSQKTI